MAFADLPIQIDSSVVKLFKFRQQGMSPRRRVFMAEFLLHARKSANLQFHTLLAY